MTSVDDNIGRGKGNSNSSALQIMVDKIEVRAEVHRTKLEQVLS